MEIASGLIKLKPDVDEKFEEWHFTISSCIEEAIATLEDEGVEVEPKIRIISARKATKKEQGVYFRR